MNDTDKYGTFSGQIIPEVEKCIILVDYKKETII